MVLTVALWFVMEIIGAFLGVFILGESGAYVFGLLFAALGGLISLLICKNVSFGTYVDPKAAYVQQVVSSSEKLNVPATLMIVRDKSAVGCAVSYDLCLNGNPIGQIANGMILNATTDLRQNIISIRDSFTGADLVQMPFMVNDGSNGEIHLKSGKFLPASCRGVYFENQQTKPTYNPALAAQAVATTPTSAPAPVQAQTSGDITCPHCGMKLSTDSLFCTVCGKKI